MKICTVVGARPQFIKAAVVSQAIRSQPGVEEVLVHTGQHFDENMSDVFFEELDIPLPKYNLGIGGGGHGQQTGRMLIEIEQVLQQERPDWMLVYGDTNSTLAGALAAAKLHIPIAHVEAGLRSFNREMPEEVNRVLTDHVSTELFAPTETAVENLVHEGFDPSQILKVGDVMFDAALHFGEKVKERRDLLDELEIESGAFVLATVHRAGNTDDPARLAAIYKALQGLGEELPVVWPVHPRTRQALQRNGLTIETTEAVRFTDPLSYFDMVTLESHCRLVATDSGGVQKEAYFFGKPCVVFRAETEWKELVSLGWTRLLDPTDAQTVEAGLVEMLARPQPAAVSNAPFGDGDASVQIVRRLNRAA
ncbi:MAG: UDP-N-acetylglucosamine 2-epimerase (non-hydrolyzing) [Planctomycetaceae bacterium]|nr:UDP-N-acetylglucosamine 2-epimerase (non-hydrolyzing) [Planctomycetaceae bacterium]